MDEITIKLVHDPAYFKEIYYRDGQGNILTYKPTRKVIIILFIILLLTAIAFFLTYQSPILRWIPVAGLIALLVAGIKSNKVISNYSKWKKQTNLYIKDLTKYNSYRIRLTLTAVEMTLDENTYIDKWENIKSLEIHESYIVLYKTEESTYLLPAKSMRQHEFESLKDFIKNKVLAPAPEQSAAK